MRLLMILLGLMLFVSCEETNPIAPDIDIEDLNASDEEPIELDEFVKIYDKDLIETDSYVFVIENGRKRVFIINKQGNILYEWSFEKSLGNDIELEENGQLLGLFKPESTSFSFGGFGGVAQIINPDNSVAWSYEINNENQLAHHDLERMPNGNVMIMVWERMTKDLANQKGIETEVDIYSESLFEVDPNTNEVVWTWRSADHIIQDRLETAANYGSISENPSKIDFNYNLMDNGDIMHANGIDYDPEHDLIYMSVNFFSEVWVIDHSTTSDEAATDTGGNYGIGGDLVYRFGNPNVFQGEEERFFYKNHFPNLIEGSQYPGQGNILVYMNGFNVEQSTVFEIELPVSDYPTYVNPNIKWSFTNPIMYYDKLSGSDRMRNGNTLITEGDYGIWEVTRNREIAWKYESYGPAFWRSYVLYSDEPGVKSLNLE
jgi:hypothetical protein